MPAKKPPLKSLFKNVPEKGGVYQTTRHNKITRDTLIDILKRYGYNYKTYELPEGIHVIEAWD